jgi:hypothetical protein
VKYGLSQFGAEVGGVANIIVSTCFFISTFVGKILFMNEVIMQLFFHKKTIFSEQPI